MTKFLRVALIVLFAFWIADVSAAQEASTAESEAEKASELARELANPVANLWSLQFQFNNVQLTNDRWSYNLNFQPVMPLSLTKDLNLITRPVIQVYNSAPYQTSTGADARTTNFGDWTQLELLSPANTGHWLLGAGRTVHLPDGRLGLHEPGEIPGRPGCRGRLHDQGIHPRRLPAAVVVDHGRRQPPGYQPMNIQPIINFFFHGGWNVGYSGNILVELVEKGIATMTGRCHRSGRRKGPQVRAATREGRARRPVHGHAARARRAEVEHPDPVHARAAQADRGSVE